MASMLSREGVLALALGHEALGRLHLALQLPVDDHLHLDEEHEEAHHGMKGAQAERHQGAEQREHARLQQQVEANDGEDDDDHQLCHEDLDAGEHARARPPQRPPERRARHIVPPKKRESSSRQGLRRERLKYSCVPSSSSMESPRMVRT